MFSHLKSYDLPLHCHTETGERAVADGAGDDVIAVFCIWQLVRFCLAAVQGLSREETGVAVPARYDGQQLLLGDQVDLIHLLVVPYPDYF